MTVEALLLLLTVVTPLALVLASCVPGTASSLIRILPWAPLPGLAAVLLLPPGATAPLPDVLLGAGLMLDQPGRVFLGVTTVLWSLAGMCVGGHLAKERAAGFCRWWLATLAGNLLLIVAGDVVSFYFGFSLMSLAAFGLIVHERTREAARAARIYLILALFGETCLLLGFMVAATSAGDISIPRVVEALRSGDDRHLALALMITAFALKAGLMPLHVWLPLAHPAAPIPASAVLSGAMVKAGIWGLVRFLPVGDPLPFWGGLLVGLGLATAYGTVILGLYQTRPKTILAYSTCSQMGLLTSVLGAGAASTEPARLYEVVGLYAAHHALAKGALFLGLGVLVTSVRLFRPATMVLALMAVGIAGLPLTGGALAKLLVKEPVGQGWSSLLLSLSAVGTTLLMLRFLQTALRDVPTRSDPVPWTLTAPFYCTALAAVVIPWWLYVGLGEASIFYPLAPAAIWTGLWPVLAAAALVFACRWIPWRPRRTVPEGDMVVFAEGAALAGRRAITSLTRAMAAMPRLDALPRTLPLGWAARAEQALAHWPVVAVLLAGGVLAAWGALGS